MTMLHCNKNRQIPKVNIEMIYQPWKESEIIVIQWRYTVMDKKNTKKQKNKAISMMSGKSPPSALLEIIKLNNFLIFFKEFGKGDHFIFWQNIILFYFFTFILIERAKPNKISLYISIRLKFAIFIHHCNLRPNLQWNV